MKFPCGNFLPLGGRVGARHGYPHRREGLELARAQVLRERNIAGSLVLL